MPATCHIPAHLARLLALFADCGEAAYPVGGCVRDALLGHPPHDWDVAVTTPPETTQSLCETAGLRVVPTGIKHGTVTVLLPQSGNFSDRAGAYDPIECTTCRTEGGYSDGRHPDAVSFTGQITDDLSRRDFTVNAMALTVSPSGEVSVLDLFGGQDDLASGVIRCVGDPATRFSEDALRMLRAVRFAVKLSFDIHPDTEAAIRTLAPNLARISRERVREELAGILCSPDPVRGIALLRNTGLLPCVLPRGAEVLTDTGDLSSLPRELAPRLACLLYALPADDREDDLLSLRLPNATRKAISAICASAEMPTDPTPRMARQWRRRLGALAADALLVRRARTAENDGAADIDALVCAVHASACAKEPVTLAELAVDGRDLMALGYPEGKALQEVLHALLAIVLDDPTKNTKNKLIELAAGGGN